MGSSRTVIPSVRELKELDRALASPSPSILLTNTHIGNLAALSTRVRDSGKKVLVHADLIGGFRPDRDGLKLLRNMYRIDGVLSQNAQVVATSQKIGLWAVQRVFMMDSRSLERGLQILGESAPDGIEILPGTLALRYWDKFAPYARRSRLIAGGMITTRDDVVALFDRGYHAITASSPELWDRFEAGA